MPSFRFPKLLAPFAAGPDRLNGLGRRCARVCVRMRACVCGKRLELGLTPGQPVGVQPWEADSAGSCMLNVPTSRPPSSVTPGFPLTKSLSAWEIHAKISDTAQSPEKLEFWNCANQSESSLGYRRCLHYLHPGASNQPESGESMYHPCWEVPFTNPASAIQALFCWPCLFRYQPPTTTITK